MSSNSGQISVNIALTGADSFGTAVDGVSGKLQTLQTNAGTAGTGVQGLGTNASGATTGINSLGSSSASTGTKMLAVGGAITSVAGGVIGLVGNYEDLARSQTAVDRANKVVETSTTAHEKAVDALNKIISKGTTTQAEYEKALKKVSDTEQAVQKDKENLALAENKLNEAAAKYGTNSPQYAAAYVKVQEATKKLGDDTGKAGDAQKAYSDLVQHHVDVTSPAYIEAVQKVKSTDDAMKVAKDRAKEAQDALNLAHVRFYEQIAQTGLSAVGSITTAFALLTGGTGNAVKGMQGMETEASNMPLKMGIIGIALALLAGLLLAIATNFGGIRTAIQQFAADIVAANPWLKPFVDLIGALADNLGLTGKGFMQNTGAIPKAIKEIYDQIVQTPIGKAFADITTAIQTFFKDPFGTQGTAAQDKVRAQLLAASPGGKGIANPNNYEFGGFAGGDMTTQGGNMLPKLNQQLVASLSNQASPGEALGQALLKAVQDGFTYVLTNLPKWITSWGKALNDMLKGAMPTIDAIGASILNGIDSMLKDPKTGSHIEKGLADLFTSLGKINQAANAAIDALLATAFDPKNTPKTRAAAEQLGKDASNSMMSNFNSNVKGAQNSADWVETMRQKANAYIVSHIEGFFAPLFDIKNWETLIPKGIAALQSALTFKNFVAAATAIFGPLFAADAWGPIIPKAIATLQSALTFKNFVTAVTAIFGPLFTAEAWGPIVPKAIGALTAALTFDANKIGTAVTTIFGPLFDLNNWKTLNDKANAAIDAALKLAPKDVTAIITPLFDINNWKTLNTQANTAIDGALKLAAKDVTAIITPLFDVNNWTSLNTKANTAINGALKLAQKDFDNILGILGDASAWQSLGQKISDAFVGILTKAVNAFIDVYNQTIGRIPGTPQLQHLQAPGGATGGQPTQGPVSQAPAGTIPSGAGTPANPFAGTRFGATFAPNAPINTAPITVLVTIDGKNVATSLKPYMLGGSGALT